MPKRKETTDDIDPKQAAAVLSKERQERARKCAEEFRQMKAGLEQKYRCAVMPVVVIRAQAITVDWEVIAGE